MELTGFGGVTHSFSVFSHTVLRLNLGSDLRFYLLSTLFACGYYYYLYIYKTHFQADQLLITVHPLHLPTTNPMSARATA